MKLFIILLLASFEVFAGTCSSISRINFAANSVLTSTALNSQFNTVYNHANNLDGGCVTDGTLESSALNTSDFAVLLKGTQRGCKVNYASADTLSISKCLAGVNGNFVATTSATSVTWGCDNCAAESASQNYYVYIATGSSGTTLTPLLSTTAPNDDGYDNLGNLVLAKFRNAGSGNIDQYSIDQWLVNKFVPSDTGWIEYSPTVTGLGSYTDSGFMFKRDGNQVCIKGNLFTGTPTAVKITLPLPGEMLLDFTSFNDTNQNTLESTKFGTLTRHTTSSSNVYANSFVFVATPQAESGVDSSESAIYFGSGGWGGYSWNSKNGDDLFAASNRAIFDVCAPIQGWD